MPRLAEQLMQGLNKLDAQSFRPGDSLAVSAINHPIDAVTKFGQFLAKQTNTAAGIPDQYDNPYPLLAPSPDAQAQAAFDVAGSAQVGSFPFAPKSAGGTVGTFIGPKAATWDADKAAAAAKMLDDGVDPAQVWQQHMIGRMPDGKLFSEIDDSVAKARPYQFTPKEALDNARTNALISDNPALWERLHSMKPYADKSRNQLVNEFKTTGDEIVNAAMSDNLELARQLSGNRSGLDALLMEMGNRDYGPMSSYLKHGELGKAYPDVYKMHTRINPDDLDGIRGQYSRGNDFKGEQINLKEKPNWSEAKSTTLHEIQHAIQQREGWARGGSPEQFKQEINYNPESVPSLYELLNLIETKTNTPIDFQPSMLQDITDTSGFLDDILRGLDGDILSAGLTRQDLKRFNNQGYKFGKDTELATVLDVLADNARSEIDTIKVGDNPLKKYLRLTGEAQARATQDRLNMNMDERRANYPLAGGKLSDIPLEQLIYRYGDNGPAMAMDDNLNAGLLAKYLREGQLSPQELAQYETNAVQMTDSGKHHFNLANANAQGGTPESRAVDLGFDTPSFHGTANDFTEFSMKKSQDKEGRKLGMGWGKDKMYFADTGGAASAAASGAEYFGKGNSQNVIPAMLSLNNPIHSDDYMMMIEKEMQSGLTRDKAIAKIDKALKKQGIGGITSDVGGMAVFNPNQIRSRFAAFDPLRKDSANLLATRLLPATMLGYGMANQQDSDPLTWALSQP